MVGPRRSLSVDCVSFERSPLRLSGSIYSPDIESMTATAALVPIQIHHSDFLHRIRVALFAPHFFLLPISMSRPLRTVHHVRDICPRFRVLVIGRRNAGKTTILQKMSGSNGNDVEIRDSKGKMVSGSCFLYHKHLKE